MSNQWANVDFNKLAELLTPTFLRKRKMKAWLRVMVYPFVAVYDNWYTNRLNNLYIVHHNGQVCYLRKILNDEFDPEFRRINIDNGLNLNAFYIYSEGENKDKYLFLEEENKPIYLHEESAYAASGVDFYVSVPQDLEINEIKMRATIDFYRLASKRYKINIQ